MGISNVFNAATCEHLTAMKLTPDDIKVTYQLLLGREPENDSVVEHHRQNESFGDLIRAITASDEYRNRTGKSPFWHYNSQIDALSIIRAHEDPERMAKEGHSVNYLGVAVNVSRFFPALGIPNGLDSIPIPANWHADIAEFAAALRAVDLAGAKFTMIELGCGWGCWMNNTGVAARRLGKQIMLIGVEADQEHAGFCHEAMATNGFKTHEYRIVRGIAAARPGVALFPKQKVGGTDWGAQPIFDAPQDEVKRLLATGRYEEVPVVALEEVIHGNERIDLLHVDIQGGEADLLEGVPDRLLKKVAYILVGTHSRTIEGRLMQAMLGAGWALEIERPCIFSLEQGKPVTTVDGVQGWRNPARSPL